MNQYSQTQRLMWSRSKHDLEKIENLPSKLGNKKQGFYRYYYHDEKYGFKRSLSIWKLIGIILENHIGKPVDDAYSCFRRQVRNSSYNVMEAFMRNFFKEGERNRFFLYSARYIVWDGKIQKRYSKLEPKIIRIYTTINMVAYTHEGVKFSDLKPEVQSRYPRHLLNWVNEGEYVEFYGKNHSYMRWLKEREKENRKQRKLRRKALKEKQYRMVSEREIKDKQENLIKILKHGFDPVTSFRKEKKENYAM